MTWYVIFPKVLNMSLTAGVIICFVLFGRLLLRGVPKIYSYVLWSVVLFRLLCPVSLAAPFSFLGVLGTPVVENMEENEKNVIKTSTVEYIPSDIVHEEYPEVSIPIPGVSDAVNAQLPKGWVQTTFDPLEAPIMIATYIWMLGILGLLGYGVVSYLKLRQKLVGALQLRGNIYLADHIQSPFVMGILRPRIYLPSDLGEREKEYIILHEKHHIRRLDPVFKMLAFLALCIHWFNPLVWVAFVLSARDMEMSCDEAVVKKLGEEIRADYSASLLQLATGQKFTFGTPLAFGEGEPAGRIKNLARLRRPTILITVSAVLVCLIGIVICALNPAAEVIEVTKEEAVSQPAKGEDEIERNDIRDGGVEAFIDANQKEPEPEEKLTADELLYGDVVLTRKLDREQVCIRVDPSGLRNYLSYYYIPEEKDQRWLQNYMNNLLEEGKPYARKWEGKKEKGWDIRWQDKEFAAFEGGYLYNAHTDDTKGMVEILVEAPKLCDYVQMMLQEKMGYYNFDPADIKNIVSAKLDICSVSTDMQYYSQTLTDEKTLKLLENWFSNAEYIFGGAECANQMASLELTMESGETVQLSMATDSCTNFGINGVYYDYRPETPWDNREFFKLFDEIPWDWMEDAASELKRGGEPDTEEE